MRAAMRWRSSWGFRFTNRLEALCGGLHTAFVERNRGRRSQVLWESDEKDGMMGGYTGNYIRVERPYDPVLVNMVEDITI